MSLQDDFEKASKDVHTLSTRPNNETLLQLYALYKQATVGDVESARPGMFNIKERAKYDAWAKIRGMSSQAAMKEYVALVGTLLPNA